MPVCELTRTSLGPAVSEQYIDYLKIRIEFLLSRRRRFCDFPGVQTGYNSITGQEFPPEELYSYSWINGRGVCVFSRFADYFSAYAAELNMYAEDVLTVMEDQWRLNGGHFPFMASLDGTEKKVGVEVLPGYKSYSDLYACGGFLEYGARRQDGRRLKMAKRVFSETVDALKVGHFVVEPEPVPVDRLLENPWAVALDLANEFTKHTDDLQYLAIGAHLVGHLLDHYYVPDLGAFVEYITPDGKPFVDELGRQIVDPGHGMEFCSFALEFARLADQRGLHGECVARIRQVIPQLILWNARRGWNARHPGMFKTIDVRSGMPVNDTMPWWTAPETLVALVLAYQQIGDTAFLELFRKFHNTYFTVYMNPLTDYGPYQNISGKTGRPVDIVPACKFQDPEFHSGKNLLTIVEAVKQIQASWESRDRE
jgi:hypothetical protein